VAAVLRYHAFRVAAYYHPTDIITPYMVGNNILGHYYPRKAEGNYILGYYCPHRQRVIIS